MYPAFGDATIASGDDERPHGSVLIHSAVSSRRHTRVTLRFVRMRQILGVIVVAICVGGPIAEMFDQWDHTVQDGNDTEANAVIAALCVGLALSAAGTVVVWIRSLSWLSSSCRARRAPSDRISPSWVWCALPAPASSPPVALRV